MALNTDNQICINITIKTPAGFPSAFVTTPGTTAAELTARSVKHFVDNNQLEVEEFELALIRDNEQIALGVNESLETYEIVEGDILHLVSCQPHIDG